MDQRLLPLEAFPDESAADLKIAAFGLSAVPAQAAQVRGRSGFQAHQVQDRRGIDARQGFQHDANHGAFSRSDLGALHRQLHRRTPDDLRPFCSLQGEERRDDAS